MKSRVHDPLRLDVAAFAAEGGALHGSWPLAGFERLAAAAHEDARPGADAAVVWSLRGELRAPLSAAPQVWLHLHAEANMQLVCQRCLAPVAAALVADRHFLFVEGEDRAAALDAEIDDDVLALTRRLDVHELLEDELLLELPLVPRHGHCATPRMPGAADPGADADAPPNPFAALRGLRDRDGR